MAVGGDDNDNDNDDDPDGLQDGDDEDGVRVWLAPDREDAEGGVIVMLPAYINIILILQSIN